MKNIPPKHEEVLTAMDALVGTLRTQAQLVQSCVELMPDAPVHARNAVSLLAHRVADAVVSTQRDIFRGEIDPEAMAILQQQAAAQNGCGLGHGHEQDTESEAASQIGSLACLDANGLQTKTTSEGCEGLLCAGGKAMDSTSELRDDGGNGVKIGHVKLEVSTDLAGTRSKHRSSCASTTAQAPRLSHLSSRPSELPNMDSIKEMLEEPARSQAVSNRASTTTLWSAEKMTTKDRNSTRSSVRNSSVLRKPPPSPMETAATEQIRSSLCESNRGEFEPLDDTCFENEVPSSMCIQGVLDPSWPGRLGWDLGVMMVVVFDAMVLPFQISYREGRELDSSDELWLWLTTTFFTLDIGISFMTGYNAGVREEGYEPGDIVTDKSRIARVYLQTWFPIDLLSTIPWSVLADAISGNSEAAQMAKLTKFVKFLRGLRLIRMLRLAKLAAIWERVEARLGCSLILRQSFALIRVIAVLIGICHWNACIWWMVGQEHSLFVEMASEEAQIQWKNQRHWTTLERDIGGELSKWIEQSVWSQYVFCFYWTLGVMRTMPSEVTPVNNTERLYVMIFMFFAFSAFAICVALITQTFLKISERKRMFDEEASAVRIYMRNIGCNENMQGSVNSFLRHLYDTRRIFAKEGSLLQQLPKPIQTKIKFESLKVHFLKFQILGALPSKALLVVSEIAEVCDMHPGMAVCMQGEPAESAWVLMAGRLKVTEAAHASDDEGDCLAEHVVDEESLISTRTFFSPRTVTTVVSSELLRIRKVRFLELMTKHEEFKMSLVSKFAQFEGVKPGSVVTPSNQDSERASIVATTAIVGVAS